MLVVNISVDDRPCWKLLRIARETSCLDQAALNRLDEIRAALEHYRRSGLRLKTSNLTREVISLPSALMQQAPSQCRLSNPVDIEVDKNVIKPAWLHMPCWLVFPHYDVTNRVDLTFQFDQPLADLIDEYFMTSGERCRLPSIKVKLIDQSNTQHAELEASDES